MHHLRERSKVSLGQEVKGDLQETTEQVEEGGFAGAAGAHDGREFSGPEAAGHAVQHSLRLCNISPSPH